MYAPKFRISFYRPILASLVILLCTPLVFGQAAAQPESSWKSIEEALGRTGQSQPGDVVKFSLPRKDLHVSLQGVEIKPALALGSWRSCVGGSIEMHPGRPGASTLPPERGLQSAGRLGSDETLKFPNADLQCRRPCAINPAPLAHPWFGR